jgi:uncharacterized protein (TIGR02266 family)
MHGVSDTEPNSDAGSGEQHAGRENPRYAVDVAISADSEHNFIAAVATNLSASGVFIATPIVHPVGTELRVTIAVGEGGVVVRADGIVRWCRATDEDADHPMGIGVQFVSLDEGGESLIANFLRERSPMSRSHLPPND